MSYIKISDENIMAWKEFLENAVRLLNMYRNLLDTYVLDFFVEDFWNRISQSWQKVFSDVTPQFLANIITSPPCRSEHVLPLSLLAFRASTFAFSLPRSQVKSPKVFQDFLQSSQTVAHANIQPKTCTPFKPCVSENYIHMNSELCSNSSIFTKRNTDAGASEENKIESADVKRNFSVNTCDRLLCSSEVDTVSSTHSKSAELIDIGTPLKYDSPECIEDNIKENTPTEAITNLIIAEQISTACGLAKQEEGRLLEDSVDDQIRNLANKLTLWGDAASELSAAAGQHAHLHHAFRRHVKPKKQHEAARLATVAAMVSHATDTVLVDVGSGQGHLSRLLAYGLGTRVLCLDAQEQFTLGARKFDAQLEACMRGKGLSRTAGLHIVPPQALPHPPRHVTLTLHPDMDTNHLLQVLQQTYRSPAQCHTEKTTEISGQELKQVRTSEMEEGRITPSQTMASQQNQREAETEMDEEMNCGEKMLMSVETKNESEDETVLQRFGLLGLHTCGDLAPTMIRLFLRSHECRALISVGCCYMKMNTSGEGDSIRGYPLSVTVSSIPGHYFTYEALESSCHAIDSYAARLKSGADNLKVHCYRAVLEHILMCRYPQHKHAGLRSVSHAHTLPFPRYAQTALARLPDVTFTDEELNNTYVKEMLDRWMQVVVFYSLRLMLAPVVESIVLLDRLLYLYEQGYEALLVPLFDPSLSPRNFVLLTVKNLE